MAGRPDGTPRKPRGRPRAAVPGSKVSAWITAPHHDHLIALARKYDLSVSAVVARLLTRRLDPRADER